MNTSRKIIDRLLSNPVEFDKRGEAYGLLEYYFAGLPVETLRPLLSHTNSDVRKGAMRIVAELAVQARVLIDVIAPLAHDPVPHTSYYAMETVLLCATGADANHFVAIARELENGLEPLRQLAMRLISKGTCSQLEGALGRCKELGRSASLHEQGLRILIAEERVSDDALRDMLECSRQLPRLYGAIAASRLRRMRPALLELAASNADADVARFATDALKTEWIGSHE